MRPCKAAWVALLLFVASSKSGGQDKSSPPPSEAAEILPPLIAQAKDPIGKEPAKDLPAKDPKDKEQPPVTDVFAQAPTAGAEAPSGLNPRMIGDFPGYFTLRTITVP